MNAAWLFAMAALLLLGAPPKGEAQNPARERFALPHPEDFDIPVNGHRVIKSDAEWARFIAAYWRPKARRSIPAIDFSQWVVVAVSVHSGYRGSRPFVSGPFRALGDSIFVNVVLLPNASDCPEHGNVEIIAMRPNAGLEYVVYGFYNGEELEAPWLTRQLPLDPPSASWIDAIIAREGRTLDGTRWQAAPPRDPAPRFVELDAGLSGVCARTKREVYCWGKWDGSDHGEHVALADRVMVDDSITSLATGRASTCVLRSSGRVQCRERRVGYRFDLDSLPRASTLAAGLNSYCAITYDGAVWCWGRNDHHVLGRGPGPADSVRALPVNSGQRFRALSLGAARACALDSDGRAYCWGEVAEWVDALPELCPGARPGATARCVSTPARLRTDVTFSTIYVRENVCGLDRQGRAHCWMDGAMRVIAPQHRFRSIALAEGSICGLTKDGRAVCERAPWSEAWKWLQTPGWWTRSGPLGAASAPPRLQSLVTANETACVFTVGGDVYCWGSNQHGQLGAAATGSETNVAALVITPVSSPSRRRNLCAELDRLRHGE